MSLLPRRRAGQPGQVAVHPGWTLSPPTAESLAHEPEVAAELPASRWTSAPPLPPMAASAPAVMVTAAAPEPLSFWVEAPAAPIAAVLSAPLPSPEAVEAAVPSWTQEWESVAALPTSSGVVTALHTPPAVAVAPEAAFGGPIPAPAAVPADAAQPIATALTALDLPLPADIVAADTPLAAQASAFLQAAAPALPTPVLVAPIPPPPPTPTRTVAVPAPAQQIVDQAMRAAPTAPSRRSTVRLGFTDASVVDLRPDDPMAKALHTVADALIGRDR